MPMMEAIIKFGKTQRNKPLLVARLLGTKL